MAGFDCEDSTAFFCTELIHKVFKTALDADLYELANEKETNCMSFYPFLNPAKFTIILNHNDGEGN